MYRELFDISPDAMIAVDSTSRIVRVNTQAERLFGYSEAQLLGSGIDILIPARARNKHQAHVAHYIASPRVRSMGTGQELVGVRHDGSEFPVEIALSPISTPEGRVVVAAIRDISETQRARQALARARYDRVMAQMRDLQHGVPKDERHQIIRGDGEVRWLWERVFPIRDERGRIIGTVGAAQDITEQVRAEEALALDLDLATLLEPIHSA